VERLLRWKFKDTSARLLKVDAVAQRYGCDKVVSRHKENRGSDSVVRSHEVLRDVVPGFSQLMVW
jgi:hypothetical protein